MSGFEDWDNLVVDNNGQLVPDREGSDVAKQVLGAIWVGVSWVLVLGGCVAIGLLAPKLLKKAERSKAEPEQVAKSPVQAPGVAPGASQPIAARRQAPKPRGAFGGRQPALDKKRPVEPAFIRKREAAMKAAREAQRRAVLDAAKKRGAFVPEEKAVAAPLVVPKGTTVRTVFRILRVPIDAQRALYDREMANFRPPAYTVVMHVKPDPLEPEATEAWESCVSQDSWTNSRGTVFSGRMVDFPAGAMIEFEWEGRKFRMRSSDLDDNGQATVRWMRRYIRAQKALAEADRKKAVKAYLANKSAAKARGRAKRVADRANAISRMKQQHGAANARAWQDNFRQLFGGRR